MTSTFNSTLSAPAGVALDLAMPGPRAPGTGVRQRTVAVVGMGYVGLPTALALADAGLSVIGCDVSEARLAAIKTQQADLLPADQVRLGTYLGSDHFTLTTEGGALRVADTVLVCVPTPVDPHLVPDLSALRAACESVVTHAVIGQTIVLTSTTYVGCTRDLLIEPLRRRGLVAGRDVFVAFSPERIDPGVASHTPQNTPRVVGGATVECTRQAVEVVGCTSSLVHPVSSPEAAEMTKLLENTFRAVNIALANEFSDIARQLQIDPIEVIRAASTKPYGFMPFYPGPGVGGHCIPCDPHYLLWQLKAHRVASPVTEAAMAAIAGRPHMVVVRAQHILATAGRTLDGSRVLIVGVTYKPAVADIRESPALEIIDGLHRAGALVAYSDPMVDTLRTATGDLTNDPDPDPAAWDLVIAHTLHPDTNYSWIRNAPLVLDATYTLEHVAHRHVL